MVSAVSLPWIRNFSILRPTEKPGDVDVDEEETDPAAPFAGSVVAATMMKSAIGELDVNILVPLIT